MKTRPGVCRRRKPTMQCLGRNRRRRRIWHPWQIWLRLGSFRKHTCFAVLPSLIPRGPTVTIAAPEAESDETPLSSAAKRRSARCSHGALSPCNPSTIHALIISITDYYVQYNYRITITWTGTQHPAPPPFEISNPQISNSDFPRPSHVRHPGLVQPYPPHYSSRPGDEGTRFRNEQPPSFLPAKTPPCHKPLKTLYYSSSRSLRSHVCSQAAVTGSFRDVSGRSAGHDS